MYDYDDFEINGREGVSSHEIAMCGVNIAISVHKIAISGLKIAISGLKTALSGLKISIFCCRNCDRFGPPP